MKICKWGVGIDCDGLDGDQLSYIKNLPDKVPDISWVWHEMDRVWDDLKLDRNKPIAKQSVGGFYSHPVWIMNGIFTEVDKDSIKHRNAISDYLIKGGFFSVADYGGGSGVLARSLSSCDDNFFVDIVEPFAFGFFINRCSECKNIRYVSKFRGLYDAVIAQDVLEHVDDPIGSAFCVASHARDDGLVIFANCFYPYIKCHLPSTFYLRYTFKWIMKGMGLDYVGCVPGAEHALVFRKNRSISLDVALSYANKARVMSPLINTFAPWAGKVKRFFR